MCRAASTYRDPASPSRAGRERREPGLRASDAEREQVAEKLRSHAAEGRLGVEELEERLTTAFSARTRGELESLLADLPGRLSRPRRERPRRNHIPAPVRVALMLVLIWALTGMGYFWPMWPAIGLFFWWRAGWAPRRRGALR